MEDQGQLIRFPIFQNNNVLKFPKNGNWLTGLTLEFHLKKTFDDPYYIGLNEIQVFDLLGRNVLRSQKNNNFKLSGNPAGVFVDPNMGKDMRRVENLINGVTESKDFKDIWLTLQINPYLSK